MIKSFEYFMKGIIDYAGLFPPASIDLKTALKNYENYLNSNYFYWMLGRFIIPAGKLHLVTRPVDYFFSVILSHPSSSKETDGLRLFAPQIQTIETRLPDNLSKFKDISRYLKDIKKVINRAGIKKTDIFIEASNPAQRFEMISALSEIDIDTKLRLGLKLRCGGLDSQAFPDPNEIAAAIRACGKLDIPLKFTAGLHHPMGNYSREHDTMQYGFINVLTAAFLAFSCNLSHREIENCLIDENFDNFVFKDTNFSWKNSSIPAHEIKKLRRKKVIGFGSCSFEEPIADLMSLGVLAKTGE